MNKLNPSIRMTQNVSTGELLVEYTILSPGQKLTEDFVEQIAINELTINNLLGVRVEVSLKYGGKGKPLSVGGSFVLERALKFDENKPFLEMVLFGPEEDGTGKIRRGGGIVRHEDIDLE